jgi:hypothetical protein
LIIETEKSILVVELHDLYLKQFVFAKQNNSLPKQIFVNEKSRAFVTIIRSFCKIIVDITKNAGNKINFYSAQAFLKIPQPLLLKTKQYQTRVY